ncbi:RIO1 family-domain-containing protein [Crepidotus variabilis]|uniref:Serine/threonine-protein kinase RIO1 n=1 Tax=Crepidotus variabilis TaxID=179855 RepID=A0A9P6EQC7_9AGAR|nr:RIO1 family-domain-containing protein [Crepidotus variabilis]
MTSAAEPIVLGQFDDPEAAPRAGNAFIDTYDPAQDQFSDNRSDEELDEDDIDEEYDDSRVDDEDWEVAERDFTKQYNRLRQHAAVRTGNAQGFSSALKQGVSVASLPAVNHPKSATVSSNSVLMSTISKDRTTDQLAALAKYNSRIARIEIPYVMGVGINRKGPSAHANLKDKSDRATNEQVLDPRTRLILFKMIGRELITEVNGCISTGKEANVYHGLTPAGKHLAIKIYKTSILIFKDRDKYVTGEYRFRRGYSRNPRKMVRLWAEKEMRNLKRLVTAGINAPDPLEVRENVLVMDFVGDSEGWASPRLKDAKLPSEAVQSLYIDMVLIVRRMFHVCKLVHADLSEYNILYHNGQLWIIDVSQSVEHDHPAAFDFLRNDIKNIEDFFGRLGAQCLGLRRCFEFVTKEKLSEDASTDDMVLNTWLEEKIDPKQEESFTSNQTVTAGEIDLSKQKDQAHEDSVFLHSFIPRTLNEVFDPERDVERLNQGDRNLIYADTIGLVPAEDAVVELSRRRVANQDSSLRLEPAEQSLQGGTETDDKSEGSDEDDETAAFKDKMPRGHRHEDKDVKKERKKQVKAEQKERRKSKMPKAEKKRIIKKTKA